MPALGEQVVESGRAFGAVFRNPGLRRVNLAFAGSMIGDWAYSVAVVVWAYEEVGATALGLYGVVRFVSMAILAPFAATLADRFPRKRVMIGADLSRAVVVIAAAGVIAADGPTLLVFGLALLTGLLSLAFRPAQAALLPDLADNPRELTSANVVASTIEGVGFFVGPALAGFLLAVADVELVYLVNAATFLLSAAMIIGLHEPSSAADDADGAAAEGDGGFMQEVVAGFRTIGANRDLRLIVFLMSAQTVVAGASLVYEVGIALDLLEIGESGVGLLGSFLGIGSIVGGFVVLLLATRGRLATDFGIGVVLWSLPLVLVAVWPALVPALVAMFLIGLANPLVDANGYTIVQRLAPPAVMGRVFGALESLAIAGMAVGALVMPILIATVGLRWGLAVLGGGIAVVALAGFGGLRRIDDTALAPATLPLLRGVPMLAVLPQPVLERLAHVLVPVTVPAGTELFREGDAADRFWIIERGEAVVSIGGEHVRRLGAGDSFGEIALLRDVPRTATVTAGDDELVLQGLDRDDFLPAVTGHGEAHEVADSTVDRWLATG